MKKYLISSLFILLLATSCISHHLEGDTVHTTLIDAGSNYAFAKACYDDSANSELDLEERLFAIRAYEEFVTADSLRLKALFRKTYIFSKKGQTDSAIYYANKMKVLAGESNNYLYKGEALLKLGSYHRRQHKIEAAFRFYNDAYLTFKIINDSLNISSSLLSMSIIQRSTGDFIGSKNTAIDGLTYLGKISDNGTRIGLLQNISIALREEGNTAKALLYNDKALAIYQKDWVYITLQNSKANILSDQGYYSDAITILKGLKASIDLDDQSLRYARIIDNLGYILWKQDSVNPYSEKYLIDARNIRLKNNSERSLIASNIHLSKYYETKNPERALRFAEDALGNAKQVNSQTSQLEALELIISLKENPKEEALLYAAINKRLATLNIRNRELYAISKYENDQLIKQNLSTEADNLKKEKLNNLYLFGFVILLFVSLVVFIFLRNKHALEKQHKVIETESRISKKIHDELANDVYSAMVQLENNSVSIPEIINDLETIYQNARDISQEKTVYKTNEEFILDLKRTLGSFTSNTTNVIVKGLKDELWIDVSEMKKVTTIRVLKELLVNMKKHSKASVVSIIFSKEGGNLSCTYTDNGVWVSKNELIHGTGLVNAENRIKAVKGTFIFDTTNRKGLKIYIHIPL